MSKSVWDDLPKTEQDKYLERARFLIENGYFNQAIEIEDLAKLIYDKRRA